jgi:hypothetical protein
MMSMNRPDTQLPDAHLPDARLPIAHVIDSLVADLAPVAPMHSGPAIARTAAAVLASVALIALSLGQRDHVSALFLLSAGLFLVLGIATALTLIAMSRPQVGSDRTGWGWAAAMAALLPATTLVLGFSHMPSAWAESDPGAGLLCLAMGLVAGLASAAVLIAWLRRGAPTSPERAGWIVGIAAGSLGMFAFSLYCPDDSIYHIGLWHSASVVTAALLGRLIVPRLIRW